MQNLMQQVRFCHEIEVSQTWLKSLARQSLDPKNIHDYFYFHQVHYQLYSTTTDQSLTVQ